MLNHNTAPRQFCQRPKSDKITDPNHGLFWKRCCAIV